MIKDPQVFLKHILESIDWIEKDVDAKDSAKEVLASETLRHSLLSFRPAPAASPESTVDLVG